ncbi:MAG: tetratricopeptide repeat protein [Leptothrix sp. (in: b-proteobacteria)]
MTACSSKADRIESGLRKGSDFVGAGDLDKANVEVRNVLQIDPKSARAYLIAGQVEDAKSNFRGAYAHYQKVLELQPGVIGAQLGLARLYLLSGEVDNAEQQINAVLKVEPANLRAQVLAIALTARRGKAEQALADAKRFLDAKPVLEAESSLLLAGLYVNAKDNEAALRVLDAAIAVEAKNPSHSLNLLQMAAEVASLAPPADAAAAGRAVGYYRAATTAAPKNGPLWRAWALMHVRRNQLDEAEAVLRAAILAQPDEAPRQLALIEFTAAFRGVPATEKVFADAIAAKPKMSELRFALVEFHRVQNHPDEVRRTLDAIVALGKDEPAGLQARGQIAALQLAAGETDAARTTLDEVIKVNPRDANGLVLRSRIALAAGKPRDAITDLRAAAKDRPGNAEVASLLAGAHRAVGEAQLGREVLADAAKFAPEDAGLRLLLAGDSATERDFKSALIEVNEAVRLAPQNPRPQQVKAELLLASGDSVGAEKAAQVLIERFPKNPLGPMTLGRVLANEKKLDAALRQYDAAAQLAPKAAEPVLAAVAQLVGQKRWPEVARRIDALEAINPALPLAKQMRGEMALAKGELPLAEQQFQAVVAMPGATAANYKNLAAVRFARKDVDGGLATLQAGQQAHPKDQVLPAAHAEWLLRLNRIDDAIAIYDDLLKRAPDNETALNNLAYTLAESKRDDASLQRALQLASRFDTSAQAGQLDTLGFIRYRLGQFDQASATLERAVAIAPNEPSLQLHLGMALLKKADKAEADRGRALLRKLVASKAALPQIAEARELLAKS